MEQKKFKRFAVGTFVIASGLVYYFWCYYINGVYNVVPFSFRDLYKYCYIGQTKIDSEDLLNEKIYAVGFKRKPTLEIIMINMHVCVE